MQTRGSTKSATDMTPEQIAEHLSNLIVPWIAERTGLSAETIMKVFDAQNAFWESQVEKIGGRSIHLWFVDSDDSDA